MLFAINWVYKVMAKTNFYPMDVDKVCEDTSTKLLKDDEHAIILGKAKPSAEQGESHDCHIKIAPSEENKLKHLQLRFDSFYIDDCKIRLQINQAPHSAPEDVQEMESLSCQSTTPAVLYADEGNLIHIKLHKDAKARADYNFRINVTSTDGPMETGGLNSNVVIGLCVGGGVLLLLCLLFLLYKCCRKSNNSRDLPSVNANQLDQTSDLNRSKPPLVTPPIESEVTPPEQHALLDNVPLSGQHNGLPPGGGGDAEDSFTELQALAADPTNNAPARDYSMRAARGDSPPPSYEDAMELPVPAQSFHQDNHV